MHSINLKKLTSITLGFSALALAGSTSIQYAQAQVIELPGIIVEASSLDGEGVSTEQIGSSVSVITGKDLEQQKIRHVADALRGLPGLSVSRTGSFGGLTNVRIRGAEANHTLVIIDGVEANSNDDGSFNFSDLSAENIEQIEIIRGPQSGIYGSRALGGVINITTKKGRGPLTVTAKGELGSFDTKSGSVNISGGNEKLYGSLTVDRFKTDGFNIAPSGSEKDGAERTSVFFNGGFHPLDNLKINFMFRSVNKDGDRDEQAFFSGEQEDAPSYFSTDSILAGMKIRLDTFDKKWIHKFNATKNMTDRADNGRFGPSENDSDSNELSYTNTWLLPTTNGILNKHSFTSLAEYREESLTPSSDNIERKRERFSYAAEYKAEFARQLSLSASIRHDDNKQFEDFTTYRIAGSWRVPDSGLRLHSNIGTGVVFPNMFEQFGFIKDTFKPNPDLKPEESFGWDIGVEWTSPSRRFTIDVTYFDQDLKNEIETIFFNPTDPDTGLPIIDPDTGFPLFLSTAQNRDGKSKRKGIEVTATANITKNLSLTGGYTYLDATEPDGSEEVRRPKHSANAKVNWRFDEGKGNLNLGVNYNGEMKDLAFPEFVPTTVTLNDYLFVSLAGSYKVQPNVELFGRVENLLDEDYQEIFGFESAGISAYAGVKIKLGPNE